MKSFCTKYMLQKEGVRYLWKATSSVFDVITSFSEVAREVWGEKWPWRYMLEPCDIACL